jgi:surfeit locus 1 family protein
MKALSQYRFSPKLVPSLIALGMLAVLIALGVWQLQRADWKEQLLVERRLKLAVRQLMMVIVIPSSKDLFYMPVHVRAGKTTQETMQVREWDATKGWGFQSYTKVEQEGVPPFIVKGDFQPAPMEAKTPPPEHKQAKFDATGVLVPPVLKLPAGWREPPLFIPFKNFEDEAFEAFKKTALDIPNNHRMYAFIWFSLAFALGIIYFLSQSVKLDRKTP